MKDIQGGLKVMGLLSMPINKKICKLSVLHYNTGLYKSKSFVEKKCFEFNSGILINTKYSGPRLNLRFLYCQVN